MVKTNSIIILVLFGVGLLLTIGGLIVGICWPYIYNPILNTQVSLTPTSTNYNLWKKTPIPMYLKIYMFSLTNPEEFITVKGTKPNFEELGPYVFREVDYKVNLVWNANNTVTYQRKRVWYFEESMSNGNLFDKVINVNAVTASVAYALRDQSKGIKLFANSLMKSINQTLLITKTVKELLFDGYRDKMLDIARDLNVTNIPIDKFGWFYTRNASASYDGTFNMLTGTNDLKQLGLLTEWNYNSSVSFYPGECGKVRGSNGDLWPPLSDNKTISFFVSDICTSMSATYDNITVHEGLTGVRYISDETTFDNGTNVNSRRCYCGKECIPSGVLDISTCKWGAPAFISLPHFYLADPYYRKMVNGMKPNKEKHQLSISLEPKTGVPLRVNAQLQLNLLIQPDSVLDLFKNVTTTYMPMLWFTQEAVLTPHYATLIKFILIMETWGSVTFYGISAIGILITAICIFAYYRVNFKKDDTQTLLS